ncbi:heme-binding protein [Pseudarthrobacter sp. AL07]|uniref:GlcG/HbpS family heme-binding protein n=1 Tax=unclassified Pseudarthrobacter TaxID=2647000 RepID=UPI00249A2D10|nr:MULTISPECIES: heme-binding protein [unclassified Pseudarthrobacter]MDI3195510.1 heme-binding protein [Pseudarthrobacter sp. AL20]MDI3209651.1 heme-binding protein [Pseudarthrobacter sp. AL07]
MIEEAQKIAAAAEKAAKDAGLSIVISIVDTHGNPVLLHRMDGAPLHSLDMAFRKAYTAASFDVATEELTDQVQPGQPLYGLAVNSGSKLIAFGGGAPTNLTKGEKVGVGISGGTTQEDIDILRKALGATTRP